MASFRGDLDSEIQSYIEHETQLNIDRGMAPAEARSAALRKFGNRTHVMEDVFYQSRPAFLHGLMQDTRYALRNLRRSPPFTLLAILSLSLGIAVNASVFSLICAAVYPRLPYQDYPQIMRLQTVRPGRGLLSNLAAADLRAVREQSRSFRDLAAQQELSFNTAVPGAPPERLLAMRVTPGFFRFLGVAPWKGRDFNEEDARPGAPPAVLIGYGFWERRFDRSPAAVAATLRLDGQSYTIVGVLPPWFHWLHRRNTGCGSSLGNGGRCVDVYVPSSFESANSSDRDLFVMGRLAAGVSANRAEAEFRSIAAGLEAQDPAGHKGWGARLMTLDRSLHALQPGFVVMQCAVAFVLLIACANVANLLLARSAARSRELAVRSAIGATRGRLIRQLLTEGAILAVLASAAGLALVNVGARLMAASAQLDLLDGVIDFRVVAFTMALSMITALLFAVFPAMQVSRIGAAESLRLAGRTFSAARRSSRTRNALVVVEIGLSMVLLIGAVLMTRSLSSQLQIPLGFEPRNLLFARIPLTDDRYGDETLRATTLRQVLARAQAIPGVTAAALVSGPPLHSGDTVAASQPDDSRDSKDLPKVRYRAVTADYFRLLGVPIEHGRDFLPSDSGHSVVIVNRTLANSFWPGQNPVGQRLRIGGSTIAEVMGVVPDLKDQDIRERAHSELVALSETPGRVPWILVRLHGDRGTFVNSLQGVLAGLDPGLPLAGVQSMTAEIDDHVIEVRASVEWLAGFALIALCMAALGIYGVISYMVTQRRQEIGVRMAMGAGASQIVRMVVIHTARLAGLGIVAGLLLAAAVTRALSAVLYGVSPMDPFTFGAAAMFLFLVALVAVVAPLRASAAVDPVEALRCD